MKKSIITILACCMLFLGLKADLHGDNKNILVENGIEYSLSSQRDADNKYEEVHIKFYTVENYSISSVSADNIVANKLDQSNYMVRLPQGNHSIVVKYFDGTSTQTAAFDIDIKTFKSDIRKSNSDFSYLNVTKSVNEVSTGGEVVFNVQVNILANDYDTYTLQIHTPNKYKPSIVGDKLKEIKLSDYPNDFIKVGTYNRSDFGGTSEINFDVIVSTDAGLTPHLHNLDVNFRLVNSSNEVVQTINHKVIQKVSNFSIIPKAKVVGVAYFNEVSLQASRPVIGMASSLGSKVTHSNSSFLTPVHYRFDMVTSSNVTQGIRNFQSLTSEFDLPHGAVFNPSLANNDKWVLSDDGKKLTQVSTIPKNFQRLMNAGKAEQAQSIRQDILYDLVLLFPNYDTTKPIEVNMNVKFIPASESTEPSSDANDEIYNINNKITFNGSVSAYSNPFDTINMTFKSINNRFYDIPLSNEQFVSKWSLDIKNPTQERFEIDSVGKMDENGSVLGAFGSYYRVPISEYMRLTKITFQPTSNVLSNDYVLAYKKVDGSSGSIDVSLNTETHEILFSDNIVGFTINPKNADSLYLYGNKTLSLEMEFKILDPSKAIRESIADKTKLVSLQNTVKLKGNYVDGSLNPLGNGIDVEDKKYLNSTIPDNNFTASFSIVDSSSKNLTTAVTGTKASLTNSLNFSSGVVGTTIKGLTIVNVFPQGLEVENSNITFSSNSQHLEFLDKPLRIKESKIIRNYKSTGKTAVFITLNDVTLTKDVVNLTSINPKVEVTFSNYANIQNLFENYIYVAADSGYQLNPNGIGYGLDSNAVSGSATGYVLKNSLDVIYSPPKELVRISSGSGSLDNGIKINGRDSISRTELNKITTLNFTLNNNFDKNNPSGVFEGLRILGLIPKTNNKIALSGTKYVTANTSLITFLENAKDNNSHNHLFDIYYTYKSFENENQTDLVNLQTNAASFLDGILSEDLISVNSRNSIDFDLVTAVLLIQKPGTKFESDNRISFDLKVRVEDYNALNPKESYFGSSFFVSTGPQQAAMANLTKTVVESYEVSGRAYFDVDNNNVFNNVDKVMSNQVLEIKNNSSLELPIIVRTDSEGKYSFRTFSSGSYWINFINPPHFISRYKVNNLLANNAADISLDINNNNQTLDVLTSLKDNLIQLNQSMLDYDGSPFSDASHVSIDYELLIDGKPYNGYAFDDSFNEITITNGKFTLQQNGNITIPAVPSGSTYVISTFDKIYNFTQKGGVVNGNITIDLVHKVKSKEVVVNTTWNGLTSYDYDLSLIGRNTRYNKSQQLTVNGLTVNFGFRPLTDIYGEEIIYSIDLEKRLGVRSEYILSDATIFNVTQTQLRDISVYLDWIGGDVEEHYSSVSLYANGTYLNTSSNVKDTFTWKDLPVNDDKGIPIDYTITQAPLNNYDAIIQGFNITNYLVKDIDVLIEWIGSSPSQEKSIVKLLKDDQLIETREVVNKLNYTFHRYPVYDSSGLEHKYSIEYLPIDGFKTEINGFTITNQAIRNIVVTTKWLGLKDNLPNTTVNLYKDGLFFMSQTSVPGIPIIFSNLDVSDLNGVNHKYTVSQNSVPGYRTIVNDFSIVNIPITSLTIDIEWIGGPPNKPHSEITILKNGVPLLTEVVKDINEISISDLDTYDELDRVIIYTVSQKTIPNYASQINGFKISNTFISPLIDIEAKIEWVGISENIPNTSISLVRKIIGENLKVRNQPEYEIVFTDVLIKGGNLSYIWENLPIYNNDGIPYEYSLRQVPLKGFTTMVKGLTIINTFIDNLDDNSIDSNNTESSGPISKNPNADEKIPENVENNGVQNEKDQENSDGFYSSEQRPSLPMTGIERKSYSYFIMIFVGTVLLLRNTKFLPLSFIKKFGKATSEK